MNISIDKQAATSTFNPDDGGSITLSDANVVLEEIKFDVLQDTMKLVFRVNDSLNTRVITYGIDTTAGNQTKLTQMFAGWLTQLQTDFPDDFTGFSVT